VKLKISIFLKGHIIMKLKAIILSSVMFLSFSFANAQDNSKLSSDVQGVLKFLNAPQNKNDLLNNTQYQHDTELVMFVMKSVEDKHIKDINKQIEFINSFKVSNDTKQQAISYIKQHIKYSDHEKVSYGVYMLKICNELPRVNNCIMDYRPQAPHCFPQRSNICCPR
jgi:hypothetical protein